MPTNEEIADKHSQNYYASRHMPNLSATEGIKQSTIEACDEARADELARIIKLAESFHCCPNCGNPDAEKHFCDKCNQRIVVRADAYYFAEYLKKLR